MKGIGNIQKMMKQAKEMQDRLQKEMAEMRIEGSSGGGMVTVVLNGSKNLISLTINPEVVDKEDTEMLQDLIVAAFNDANTKVEEELSTKMGAFGAGLKIPGLF
jgi:DNA-binding YbaB/EbfC family protein